MVLGALSLQYFGPYTVLISSGSPSSRTSSWLNSLQVNSDGKKLKLMHSSASWHVRWHSVALPLVEVLMVRPMINVPRLKHPSEILSGLNSLDHIINKVPKFVHMYVGSGKGNYKDDDRSSCVQHAVCEPCTRLWHISNM